MYSIDDLILFSKIVESKSFIKAAANLRLAVSTISRKMKILEDELHFPLFINDGRNMKLTESGVLLYNRLWQDKDIFNNLDHFISSIATAKNSIRGSLKVMLPSFVAEYYVTPYISEFLYKYPDVNIEIIYPAHKVDSINDEVDIALLNYIPNKQNQKFVKMFTLNINLYCTNEYAEKYGLPVTPKDLSSHLVVGITDYGGQHIEQVEFRNLKTGMIDTYVISKRLIINNFRQCFTVVNQHNTIAPLFEAVANEQTNLVQVLPDYTISHAQQSYYITTHPHRNISATKAFIEFIRAKVLEQNQLKKSHYA